jgi:hypothetical protein
VTGESKKYIGVTFSDDLSWHEHIDKMISKINQRLGVMGVPGGGGANKAKSGNIRFTVGEYWLIIKINGTNSVNFVGNSVNVVENMLFF